MLDNTKTITSVTYNGSNFPIGGGSSMPLAGTSWSIKCGEPLTYFENNFGYIIHRDQCTIEIEGIPTYDRQIVHPAGMFLNSIEPSAIVKSPIYFTFTAIKEKGMIEIEVDYYIISTQDSALQAIDDGGGTHELTKLIIKFNDDAQLVADEGLSAWLEANAVKQ